MTIEDYCISLNPNNFFLVVLGVVDMCHDLLIGNIEYIADPLCNDRVNTTYPQVVFGH